MDDFTLQCLYQNKADFEAGRITNTTYINTLLSLFKYKNGGYINSEEYLVYPDCRPKEQIVFTSESEESE